ncbi:hypothetical protein, partial [Shouchella clausii]|uniref:hypothetical protein n=1 Tax=Shouchella clausii TaxID=79880 RepID=UPI00280A9883
SHSQLAKLAPKYTKKAIIAIPARNMREAMIGITLFSVFEQKQITAKTNIAIILKGMKEPYSFNVN